MDMIIGEGIDIKILFTTIFLGLLSFYSIRIYQYFQFGRNGRFKKWRLPNFNLTKAIDLFMLNLFMLFFLFLFYYFIKSFNLRAFDLLIIACLVILLLAFVVSMYSTIRNLSGEHRIEKYFFILFALIIGLLQIVAYVFMIWIIFSKVEENSVISQIFTWSISSVLWSFIHMAWAWTFSKTVVTKKMYLYTNKAEESILIDSFDIYNDYIIAYGSDSDKRYFIPRENIFSIEVQKDDSRS